MLAAAGTLGSVEEEAGGLRQLLVVDREGEDSYYFTLELHNRGDEPLTLRFMSEELADFVLLRDGAEIWSMGRTQSYVQEETSIEIEAGRGYRILIGWDGLLDDGSRAPAGCYTLLARHFSQLAAAPLSLHFEINAPREPEPPCVGDPLPAASVLKADGSKSSYDDVPAAHWSYAALDYVMRIGLLEGYPADFFGGKRLLTRYEFAQAIARLLDTIENSTETLPLHVCQIAADLEEEYSDQVSHCFKPSMAVLLEQESERRSASSYDDVPLDHWSYGALHSFTQAGWLEGYPEGFFNGERVLTRYEFGQATARARDWTEFTTVPHADLLLISALEEEYAVELAEINGWIEGLGESLVEYDREIAVPLDHWAYNALSYLQDLGWLAGYEEGYFIRSEALSRFEIAQAIAALLDEIEASRDAGEPASEQIQIMANTLRAEFSEQIQ